MPTPVLPERLRLATLVAAFGLALAGVLHLAILLGGPEWFAAFRAPPALVEMARTGHPRAALSCIVIALILGGFAALGLAAAGWLRRPPLLRTALALFGAVLLLRGLLFIPLQVWAPQLLSRLCDCREVDPFIVVSSLLCLLLGGTYLLAALQLRPDCLRQP